MRFTGADARRAENLFTAMRNSRLRDIPETVTGHLHGLARGALDDALATGCRVDATVPDLAPLRDLPSSDAATLWLQALLAQRDESRFRTDDARRELLAAVGTVVADTVRDAVRDEQRCRDEQEARTGRDAPECYSDDEQRQRICVWDELDLTLVPSGVWGVLGAAAYAAIQEILRSGGEVAAWDIEVRPAAPDRPVPSVIAVHIIDATLSDNPDGPDGPDAADSVRVSGRELLVRDLDPAALQELTELRAHDRALLQGWWVSALRHTAEDMSVPGDTSFYDRDAVLPTDVAIRSAAVNMCLPFRDPDGRIRRPHGVAVELTRIDGPEDAVREVRRCWRDNHDICDAQLLGLLRTVADGALHDAVSRYGTDAIVTGFSVKGTLVRTGYTSDDGHRGVTAVVVRPMDTRVLAWLSGVVEGSPSGANAAWVRVLRQVTEHVADRRGLPVEDVTAVVENSADALALAEYEATAPEHP
jgi:hypothetical protein